MLSTLVGEIGKSREALLIGGDDPLRCREDRQKLNICSTAVKKIQENPYCMFYSRSQETVAQGSNLTPYLFFFLNI